MLENTTKSIKSDLAKKIEKGDFVTLSKILGITGESARARFKRGNIQAINLMTSIVTNKEKFIFKMKSKL